MRRITLCLPYYLNKGMLERQYSAMESLPARLRDQLGMIVVDDGSPRDPATGRNIGLPLSVYRISVDIRWNQDAARNIAVHHAKTQWVLLTDMDHLVPEETWSALLESPFKANKEYVYRFSRCTLDRDDPPKISPYKPHPNSWLMTRAQYDHIGGMDERFAGHYGTDSEFRDRINTRARNVVMMPMVLWRVPRTTIPDASTTTYTRKGDPIDDGAIPRIKAIRNSELGWTTKRLSFPYTQVGHWSQ
jgi:glycosyltransferase involved in cell wall biosynthesis